MVLGCVYQKGYSCGLKILDFEYGQITVRNSKGAKDRMTMLPQSLIEPLQQQLEKTRAIHQLDLSLGYGTVYLPYALERKYPNAHREWKAIRFSILETVC